MRTLLFDTALLPHGWANHVAITIDDHGDIAQVVPTAPDPTMACIHGCLLPGIPNLHSHAHQRAMAGLAEYVGESTDNFWSWREIMYSYVNRMTPPQLESIAAQLYVEMLKSGYTTVAEFQYLHHDPDGKPYSNCAEMSLRTCAAARTAGIGMTSLPVLYRFSDFGDKAPRPEQNRFLNDATGYLRIVSEIAKQVADDRNMSFGIAPHSLRAINPTLLDEVIEDSPNDDQPIHIHVAEQSKEVDACVRWSGKRPVEWLLTNCDIDHRWCLIHATHMNEAETKRLAQTGAVVGICPSTEANLGDGFFNARNYIQNKGQFGIGSDSQITVSPVEEMRWFEYGQRLRHQSRNIVVNRQYGSTGRSLFDRSVSGGAQACGRKIGRIEAGYRADFIVLDTEHPLLHARQGDAVLDSWIFSGNANLVRDVFVGGRQVITDGIHDHEEQISGDFNNAMRQLHG